MAQSGGVKVLPCWQPRVAAFADGLGCARTSKNMSLFPLCSMSDRKRRRSRMLTIFERCIVLAAVAVATTLTASAQTFEKKNYNYSEWAKGRFSEAVTVIGPGKMIFLAGVGSEDENGKPGDILYKGDFDGQCKYAYDKIKKSLEKNGASLADAVKMVTYITDSRNQADYGKCRSEAFGSNPLPAHTLVNISQLAWPGMMVEIDVTAIVPLK
jgi:enamine deaminase RidA (YjgF/YER057c/UK114 family)